MRTLGTTFVSWFILILFLLPIFWLVVSSFKKPTEIFSMPPKLFFSPTLESYSTVILRTPIWQFAINSLVVCTVSVLLAMFVGSLAAYAFDRFRFAGNKDLFFWVVSTRMAPPIVVVVPFFFIVRHLGLYDTRTALMVIYLVFNLPFAIWMMSGYFKQVPVELDEAALVEGCTRFQVLRYIILPLIKPGIAATAIMSFIFSWNEFLFAFLLTGAKAKTVPVGIAGFITQTGIRWGELTAAGTIILVPVLILSLFIGGYFIRGLLEGSLKS